MSEALPTSLDATGMLRDIQAISDSALSYLDPEDLLSTLLDRVKAVFQADTAAVLLLDEGSGQLIATAACGLEEEVRQGVRIPVGRGFAGRIAAQRRPVILDAVDHTTVLNPLLLAKGIRSLIGVPLMVAGCVLGVMHVGSLSPRRFTQEEASLLQLAADRAALAVQAAGARADRAAALALQRSLVPSALPVVPGAEMAARYVPGHGAVGGDWYDVFVLPSGELCVVMGDVAGAGLRAAVVMGRMRSVLRAYALESSDPADVLYRLDRKIQHFEPGAMATVLYAVFEPGLDRARMSSAGHLPPVISLPGEEPALAGLRSDLMIGVDAGTKRRTATVTVPPGTQFCFYTDGLVERRTHILDEGLEKLRRSTRAESPDAACVSVMTTMVGNEEARDDIALLVLRRLPSPAGPVISRN